MRRNERGNFFWKLIRMVGLFIWAFFGIFSVIGCSQGAVNITGPSSTTTTTTKEISVANDPDLQLVKEYNADFYGGFVHRWNKSVVTVYDATGRSDLQNILDEINAALGGRLTLVKSGPPGDIEIQKGSPNDSSRSSDRSDSSNVIYKAYIEISNPSEPTYIYVYKHELIHTISGFNNHTKSGIMRLGSCACPIDDEVSRTLRKLYDLPIGTKLIA